MDDAKPKEEETKEFVRPPFNFALFLGFCILAMSIHFSSVRLSRHMPHPPIVHFPSIANENMPFREFMNDWQASSFIGMSFDEFEQILATGELSGTYTIFQVERELWVDWGTDEWDDFHADPSYAAQFPVGATFERRIVDHYIFSREKLSTWLMRRIESE